MLQELLRLAREEMVLRNYSVKTIQAYTSCLFEYLSVESNALKFCNVESLRGFLAAKYEKGYAQCSYRRTDQSQIRQKIEKIPVVLLRDEILRLLDYTTNPKHRLLLALLYDSGLRVSEVVGLKVRDVSPEELVINLKQAKDQKDRMTVVPERLLVDIRR